MDFNVLDLWMESPHLWLLVMDIAAFFKCINTALKNATLLCKIADGLIIIFEKVCSHLAVEFQGVKKSL